MRETLAMRFDPRRNGLNALRLALATAVIFSHSWPIGGFGPDPVIGDRPVGRWAVAGFFAISGWLIARSRLREELAPYLWRRMLRIYPGFLVSLVVVAFVLVPVGKALGSGTSTLADSVDFVVANTLVLVRQWTIGDTLAGSPVDAWNGSLWTLVYEVICYLTVGLLVSLVPRRAVGVVIATGFLVTSAVHPLAAATGLQLPVRIHELAELTPFFFAGALLWVGRRRVTTGAAPLAGAVVWVTLVWILAAPGELAALPLAYLLLVLGIRVPVGLGSRNDVSYGMYVYAFPVQQLLTLGGARHLGVAGFVLLSVVATVPLAVASWFMVEKPVRRWKRVVGARRPVRSVERDEAGRLVGG